MKLTQNISIPAKGVTTVLILCLALVCNPLYSTDKTEPKKKDKSKVEKASSPLPIHKSQKVRFFEQFDTPAVHADLEADIVRAETDEEHQSSEIEYYRRKALQLEEYVNQTERFVEYLDEQVVLDLPVGIKRVNGNINYTILIDSMVMTPTESYLIAYMALEIPSANKKIAFRADRIPFAENGVINGDARLELLGDYTFNFFGQNSLVRIKGSDTYVEWDCYGFKRLGVTAEVEFSRDLYRPENSDGTTGKGRVVGKFSTVVTDWSDMIATVDIPPFQVTGMEGIGFQVKEAVLDMSDTENAPMIVFPDGYTSNMFMASSRKLWKGIYIRQVSVNLPTAFENQKSKKRVSISAHDMIIDNQGLTGKLSAMNLLPRDQGSMSGWAFSLDSLGISLVGNDIKAAGFRGEIVLPIADEDEPFSYTAIINPGNEYVFSISSIKATKFDVWNADVDIYAGSTIEIAYADGKFKPKARLNGKMNIGAFDEADVSLAGISFEQLEILSEKPYLRLGTFSFGSESLENALEGFPLTIEDIGARKIGDYEIGLNFSIVLNLVGEGDGGFGGEAEFELRGRYNDDEGYQSWKFKSIHLTKIGVNGTFGPVNINGKLSLFKDDEEYGDGFNGQVSAEFKPGFGVSGTAIFGKVDGFRYHFTDAMVTYGSGIPAFWILSLYGFGGGFYHNMSQVTATSGGGSEYGRTKSGLVYKPDKSVKFGLKATVQLGLTGSKETFNGDLTYTMEFNSRGGLKMIGLDGKGFLISDGDFLGDLTELQSGISDMFGDVDISVSELKKQGMISGYASIYYDFDNEVLHGDMKMYVDVLGGLFKGTGSNGLAGHSVLHFSKDEWYIYLGTPDDRLGLKIAGLFTMDGYIMVGDNIPGSPPPHEVVSEILGKDLDLDYMRDENALGTGRGFAIGGSFHMDTGNMKFLIFRARFRMGAGMDIMLKDYGDDVRCSNMSGKLGINGWYANGQTYAYVEGKIKIKFKFFWKTVKKTILELGAAVVFQTKMPNPFWMRGIVGGRYNILGGLIRGRCRFKVTIGKQCDIINGSIVNTLNVISDVTPHPNSVEVDVFTTPQAVFNMPLNKNFELIDTDEKLKSFRIILDHFKVHDDAYEIPYSHVWNESNEVLIFESYDILPPGKKLTLTLQISFEELKNGQWKTVIVNGKKVVESRKVEFDTGDAPDHIPHRNVAYSYPTINQFNFYPNEYDRGYITLKSGQPYLFETTAEWEQVGFMKLKDDRTYTFPFSYNNKSINFTLPVSLKPEEIYTLQIVNVPKNRNLAIDRNVTATASKVTVGEQTLDTEIVTNHAESAISQYEEHMVYEARFRTSKYNTFLQKLNSLNNSTGWNVPDDRAQGVHELGTTFRGDELFDKLEIKGGMGASPVVQMKADLSDNTWFNDHIYPLVYSLYAPSDGIKVEKRPLELGVPIPVKGIYLVQNYQNRMLEDHDRYAQTTYNPATIGKFSYQLDYYMFLDYLTFQRQVAMNYARTGVKTSKMSKLLTTSYPVIKQGQYKYNIKYVLPGREIETSQRHMIINNPIRYKEE